MEDDKNAIFQMRFPQKLWYLLNLKTDALLWGSTGCTILLNYRVLHCYLQSDKSIFKTVNISSFVRQLNLYGFRKVTSHLQDPLCNSSNPYMHEYAHDFFQYGRPELLNKITRKAFTTKKSFKPRIIFEASNSVNLDVYMTPLQKARRTFQFALKKATEDLYAQPSAISCNLDCEEIVEEYDNEDFNDMEWLLFKKDKSNSTKNTADEEQANFEIVKIDHNNNKDVPELIRPDNIENETQSFIDVEENEQSNQEFPQQFLSMPNLDSESQESPRAELLAEFNIDHDMDDGIVRRNTDHVTQNSLNCVLPSVGNEMSIIERAETDHYNAEWDQMFNEMMTSRNSSSDCTSDMKELYSQISQTIDLLNS